MLANTIFLNIKERYAKYSFFFVENSICFTFNNPWSHNTCGPKFCIFPQLVTLKSRYSKIVKNYVWSVSELDMSWYVPIHVLEKYQQLIFIFWRKKVIDICQIQLTYTPIHLTYTPTPTLMSYVFPFKKWIIKE